MEYNLTFTNEGMLFATFNLSGKSAGFYDLVAENLVNDTAHWSQPFSIVNGEIIPGNGTNSNIPGCSPANVEESSLLFINIESPPAARSPTTILLTVHFKNQGSVDIPLPRRILSSQRGQPLSFDPTTIDQGSSNLLLELKETGGPIGVLRPGAGGSIQVYARVQSGTNEFKLLK